TLWSGHVAPHSRIDSLEQVSQPHERQLRFGLARARTQDHKALCARNLDSRLPQRALADPRLPAQNQQPTRLRCHQEPLDLSELRPATNWYERLLLPRTETLHRHIVAPIGPRVPRARVFGVTIARKPS